MQQGDVVTKVGDTAIENSTGLTARIREAKPGQTVKVNVQRNGTSHTLTVTLGSTSAT